MRGAQASVIQQVSAWLDAGHAVWLCTVVRTFGSAPRPLGSMMAFCAGQGAVGSVSGGCIEEALFEDLASGTLLQRAARSKGPWRLRYGQSAEDQSRFSLPCGGQLHLILEHLTPDALQQQHFRELVSALQARRPIARDVCLFSGQTQLSPLPDKFQAAVQFTHNRVSISLSPSDQLLLVGMGEVTRYAAQFAEAVDFEVTVCDPRASYLALYPLHPVPVLHANPDRLIAEHFHDEHSAIITLSHDPRVDDLALMEALQTRAFFIGAMGSEQTSRARRDRLQQLGITPRQLAHLVAPVGLPIASKTPGEIALSAISQLTQVRNHLRRGSASGRIAEGYDDVCLLEALR
ncbi:MAG: XdhC family protein [Hahellaceae bacterium]|nr:XdhC family protein [Hahellaceae bacterium]